MSKKKGKPAVYCQCNGSGCTHKNNACEGIVGQHNAFFPPIRLKGPTRSRVPVLCQACIDIFSEYTRLCAEADKAALAAEMDPRRPPSLHWSKRSR